MMIGIENLRAELAHAFGGFRRASDGKHERNRNVLQVLQFRSAIGVTRQINTDIPESKHKATSQTKGVAGFSPLSGKIVHWNSFDIDPRNRFLLSVLDHNWSALAAIDRFKDGGGAADHRGWFS